MIDEIQRVPELLSWIQVEVDEKKQMGQFILTGSHQFDLSREISQSLAGRTALLKLLPFLEIKSAQTVASDAMKPARIIADILGGRVKDMSLVYGGEEYQKRSDYEVLPYREIGKWLYPHYFNRI